MTDYVQQAAFYAGQLRELLAESENVEAIDGIFEADLVRSQSFEVIGRDKNVIALRDASGFDVLLTVTGEKITTARTSAIDAARLEREAAEAAAEDDGDIEDDELLRLYRAAAPVPAEDPDVRARSGRRVGGAPTGNLTASTEPRASTRAACAWKVTARTAARGPGAQGGARELRPCASAATRPRAARDGRTTTGCRHAACHALFAQSRFGVIGGRG